MKSQSSTFIFAIYVVLITIQFVSAKVTHVDINAQGANDGTSWMDAYSFLQDALSEAAEGDEIRVAQGIYVPTQSGDQTVSFELVEGITLKGGYAGVSGDDPNARDFVLYRTILSGDLQQDDILQIDEDGDLYFANRDDNSCSVVFGNLLQGITLDGFTISGGYAREIDDGYQDEGGGLKLLNSSITIKNCIFRENWALYAGGGVYTTFGDSVAFENCTFLHNLSTYYYAGGAGISAVGGNYSFRNCVFMENQNSAIRFRTTVR